MNYNDGPPETPNTNGILTNEKRYVVFKSLPIFLIFGILSLILPPRHTVLCFATCQRARLYVRWGVIVIDPKRRPRDAHMYTHTHTVLLITSAQRKAFAEMSRCLMPAPREVAAVGIHSSSVRAARQVPRVYILPLHGHVVARERERESEKTGFLCWGWSRLGITSHKAKLPGAMM